MLTTACCLVVRIRVRVRFSVWLVSGIYITFRCRCHSRWLHILSVVVVTLPMAAHTFRCRCHSPVSCGEQCVSCVPQNVSSLRRSSKTRHMSEFSRQYKQLGAEVCRCELASLQRGGSHSGHQRWHSFILTENDYWNFEHHFTIKLDNSLHIDSRVL